MWGWEMMAVPQNEVGVYLADNWEPFAIDTPNLEPRIWLKRPKWYDRRGK